MRIDDLMKKQLGIIEEDSLLKCKGTMEHADLEAHTKLLFCSLEITIFQSWLLTIVISGLDIMA